MACDRALPERAAGRDVRGCGTDVAVGKLRHDAAHRRAVAQPGPGVVGLRRRHGAGKNHRVRTEDPRGRQDRRSARQAGPGDKRAVRAGHRSRTVDRHLRRRCPGNPGRDPPPAGQDLPRRRVGHGEGHLHRRGGRHPAGGGPRRRHRAGELPASGERCCRAAGTARHRHRRRGDVATEMGTAASGVAVGRGGGRGARRCLHPVHRFPGRSDHGIDQHRRGDGGDGRSRHLEGHGGGGVVGGSGPDDVARRPGRHGQGIRGMGQVVE